MNTNLLKLLRCLLLLSLISSANFTFGQNCSELFFSEYIEGGSNNKAVEIYNPTNNAIDLSSYSVKVVNNGGSSTNNISLSGVLQPNNVFVITHVNATTALKNSADLSTGSLSFNGDDAVLLVSATDTVDVIGVIGTDPGAYWSDGGVSTQDESLIRMASVQIGVGPDSINFDPSIEWIPLPKDDFSNIGIHASSCHSCVVNSAQITDVICDGESYVFNDTTLMTSGVYYDTIPNVGGCDSIIELTFTVNPLPTIGAGSDQTITAGTTITLLGTGGVSYMWNNGITDGVAFTPTQTLDYIVTGTDSFGCVNLDTVSITVQSTSTNTGNCSELFFSEYIEGGSENKALEIYNSSTTTIDLSNYSVQVFINGGSSASKIIPLSGMLAGDDVFLLTHLNATEALKDSADLTSIDLSFNGDDAVALVSLTDTVDVIGVIGVNPGSNWSGGGVSTQNETLIRKGTVQKGIDRNATSFDPSVEWTSLPQDDFSNIGKHTSSCHSCIVNYTQISDVVCDGVSYVFNDTTLLTSGVYYDTLQNIGGCDSIVEITFTVNPLPTIGAGSDQTITTGTTITLTGTGGVSYVWNNGITDGVAFTPLQTLDYVVTGTDAFGCVNLDTVSITVQSAQANASNCSELFFSEYIEGGGHNKAVEIYNPSTTSIDLSNYSVQLFTNGSSAAAKIIPLSGILKGDSVFVLAHSSATNALKDSADLTSGDLIFNGDDAVALVSLTDTVDVIGLIGTDPGSYWNGGGVTTQDESLIRMSSVQVGIGPNATNFNPSVEWISLPKDDFSSIGIHTSSCPRCTVDTTQLVDSICAGDVYTFNEQTLTASGVYYDTLQNIGGCDSLLVLNFTVNNLPTIVGTIGSDTICAGDSVKFTGQGGVSYTWNNGINDGGYLAPTTTMDYIVTGVSSSGCTNSDTVQIVVESALNAGIVIATADSMLCEGEGTNFTSIVNNAGTNYTLQWKRNGNNVGSGLATYISQSTSTNNNDVISCELTTVGTCGSTVISNLVTLTVNAIDSVTVSDTICLGDSLSFGGQSLTTGGIYFHTFTNVNGCDSVVELSLIVNQLPTITAMTSQDTICVGQDVLLYGTGGISYVWDNNVSDSVPTSITQTTTYNVVGKGANGCFNTDTIAIVLSTDSIPQITISVADSMLCDGEGTSFTSSVTNGLVNVTYQWKRNGNNVGTGLTTYTSQSTSTNDGDIITCEITVSNVCASSAISNPITLNVGSVDTVSLTQTICQGDTLVLGSQQLYTSGSYSETLQNVYGCDSVVELQLMVNPVESTVLTGTICEGDNYMFAGTMYQQSGTYYDSLQTSKGCDSIVSLVLVVKPIERTTINSFICSGDSYLFAGNQLTASGTYTETLTGSNSCDSIITLELIVGGTDTLVTADIICSGDSLEFGSQVLLTQGTYTETFTSTGGCDSIVSLELTVINSTFSQISETICANSSVEFDGQTLTNSGVYYDTLINAEGCDSIITFNLTVNDVYVDTLVQSVCFGDDYTFGGMVYNQAGVYVDSLQSINGCDSIVYLDLDIKTPDTVSVMESICNGTSYVFGSQTITQPGTYTEVFQNIYGCDSTVTATIGFGASSDSSLVVSICEGDIYDFGGRDVTVTGTYKDTLQNASGCDSVVTLTLSVKVNPIVSISISGGDLVSTQGDAYQWFFNGDSIAGAIGQTYTPSQNGLYTVSMLAFNGCSDSDDYQLQNVSISELSNENLSVYPNPSKGQYKLSANTKFSFVVYNLLGEVVTSSSKLETVQDLDLSFEENGVYILKVITNNNKVIIERLIKN